VYKYVCKKKNPDVCFLRRKVKDVVDVLADELCSAAVPAFAAAA